MSDDELDIVSVNGEEDDNTIIENIEDSSVFRKKYESLKKTNITL